MGAGASIVGGNPRKPTIYTLMDPSHGHMIVEGRMTAEDEELYWMAARFLIVENMMRVEEDIMIENTDWTTSTIEID